MRLYPVQDAFDVCRQVLSPQISRCRPSSQRSPATAHRQLRERQEHRRDRSVRECSALVSAVELKIVEAGQRQVEAKRAQFREFHAEQFHVPAGIQRQLVVGDDQCPFLGLAEARRAR